jgi:hypothetical protein
VTKALQRRLAELEKKQAGPLRRRYVWWREGMPEPQAEPGEELTIISWMPRREINNPIGRPCQSPHQPDAVISGPAA